MMQVIDLSHADKVKMYEKVEKEKLIEMLIEANNLISKLLQTEPICSTHQKK